MSNHVTSDRDHGDEAPMSAPDELVESLTAQVNAMREILKRAHTHPDDNDAVAEIMLAE